MSGTLLCCQSANNALCSRSRRFPVQIKRSAISAPRASNVHARSCDQAMHNNKKDGIPASQLVALTLAVVPLLIPLQVLCQEQTALEQAGGVSPEVLGLVSSTLAIPVVVFGAVSLVQQAKQAKEDKALRLKAINTHNTFLSQDFPEPSVSSNSSGAAASSEDERFSSADDPGTAAPAMLDQPERPEPTIPQAPGDSSSGTPAVEQKPPKLPPQTAVLDRPDRPEPETSTPDSNVTTRSDAAAPLLQAQASAASSIASQMPPRPYSPGTTQQAAGQARPGQAALQAEDEARMQGVKGLKDFNHPNSRQQNHTGQASDMAAKYAAKMTLLHEESAARADADSRKRRERYIMLADLQAQAQLTRLASPARIPQPSNQNTVFEIFSTVWAWILVFLRWLVLRVQASMGINHQTADIRSSAQYSGT